MIVLKSETFFLSYTKQANILCTSIDDRLSFDERLKHVSKKYWQGSQSLCKISELRTKVNTKFPVAQGSRS